MDIRADYADVRYVRTALAMERERAARRRLLTLATATRAALAHDLRGFVAIVGAAVRRRLLCGCRGVP
jgi:hypothetical protein